MVRGLERGPARPRCGRSCSRRPPARRPPRRRGPRSPSISSAPSRKPDRQLAPDALRAARPLHDGQRQSARRRRLRRAATRRSASRPNAGREGLRHRLDRRAPARPRGIHSRIRCTRRPKSRPPRHAGRAGPGAPCRAATRVAETGTRGRAAAPSMSSCAARPPSGPPPRRPPPPGPAAQVRPSASRGREDGQASPRPRRARRHRRHAGRRATRSRQKVPERASRRGPGSRAGPGRACRRRRGGAAPRPTRGPARLARARPSRRAGSPLGSPTATCLPPRAGSYRCAGREVVGGVVEHDDRGLQPLRLVDGQDAHGVADRRGASWAGPAPRGRRRCARPGAPVKPRSVRTPRSDGLPRQGHDFLEVRDLRLSAARAREGGEDAGLLVEALEERGHGEPRPQPVRRSSRSRAGPEGGRAGLGRRRRRRPRRGAAREGVGPRCRGRSRRRTTTAAPPRARRGPRGRRRRAARRGSRGPPGGRRRTCPPRR